MKILLDSSIVIAVLRKKLVLENLGDYCINPIVYMEVGYGFINIGRDLGELDKFLESKKIAVVDIGLNTARVFTKLKFKLGNKPIADNDLLVASSALEGKMELWTLNKKHFERVDGLKLL